MRAKRFQMFDEGPAMKMASGHLPPEYPLKQIKTPLVLFEGTADSLQDASLKQLPSLVGTHFVTGYEHLDFMWAENVSEKVWPLLINYLNHLGKKGKFKKPLSPPTEISKEDLMAAFEEFLDEKKIKTRNLEYFKR
jgi:hypothetical protein